MQPDQSTNEDNEFTCLLAEYNLDVDAETAAVGSDSFTRAGPLRASEQVSAPDQLDGGR